MKLRRILALIVAMLMLVAAVPAFDLSALAAYDMPYYIEVDLTNQIVTIYSTSTGVVVRQMLCSSGAQNATPTGTYYLPKKEEKLEREEWYYFRSYSCYAHYATRIYKGVLFHSIPCSHMSDASISQSALAAFGRPDSHGCVRLRWQDAEFIAKCCLEGTKVRIFRGKKKDDELRGMLYVASYTNEKGQSYEDYLGIAKDEGSLGRYSEGSDVRDLQTRLRDLGIFPGKIDGKYGGATVTSVREAQRLLGEDETGIATPAFLETIYDENAPTAENVTIQEGMSGPVVLNMQRYLRDLRLYDGAMDGIFDVDVRQAVEKFQGAYGYRADGVLTPEVQKAIYFEAGKIRALFGEESGYECDVSSGQMVLGKVIIELSIRLRQKPTSSSNALGRVGSGDLVIALERDRGWSKVQRGESVGYVKNEYLEYYDLETYALTYTGLDSGLSYTIGYTPREYYTGVQIPCEAFGEYLASNGSLDDYSGISTVARVNTEDPAVSLNLRQAPNTSSPVLAELPHGTRISVQLRSSEWSLVEWEGERGYLLNRYLEFGISPEETEADVAQVMQDSEGDATLTAAVHAAGAGKAAVYGQDSIDAELLGHLKNGVRVEVLETVDGWSHINYEGHTGYMKDIDLQFILADDIPA